MKKKDAERHPMDQKRGREKVRGKEGGGGKRILSRSPSCQGLSDMLTRDKKRE